MSIKNQNSCGRSRKFINDIKFFLRIMPTIQDMGGATMANVADPVNMQDAMTKATAEASIAAINSAIAGKEPTITAGTNAQYYRGDKTWQTLPPTTRTTSTLSLSLVGTGATGTQIDANKDSSVSCTVSTSTTSTIGGPSTSLVLLKICSTNNATEGSWTTVATFESDQTITLAIALQSVQVIKGQLCSDVPAGWYVKLVNSGTGTHSEAFVSGQQTIYG